MSHCTTAHPDQRVFFFCINGIISSTMLSDLKLCSYIIPAAFDPRVKDAVAKAVAKAAIDSGVARI